MIGMDNYGHNDDTQSSLSNEEHESLEIMSLLCDALKLSDIEQKHEQISMFMQTWNGLSQEKQKEVLQLEKKINYYVLSAFLMGIIIQKDKENNA